MVAPVVSSRVRSPLQYDYVPWSGGTAKVVSFYKDAQGFKQKRPYTVPTSCVVDTMSRLYGLKDCDSWAETPDVSPASTAASNQARSRFVAELGQGSSFGATLTAEARKTSSMLTSSVLTIVKSARAVSRGDLTTAARLLNFSPPEKTKLVVVKRRRTKSVRWDTVSENIAVKQDLGQWKKKTIKRTVWVMPNGKEVAKSLANKWLWWSYGVRPLAQDLYNGLDVLQRPLPYAKVMGKGKGTSSWSQGSGIYLETHTFESTCRVSARVTVINPNLWLANQMGLVNPLLWVNEAVPFSFVLDWFSNWSDVLSQYTDFVGLEIAEPITTQLGTLTQTGRFIEPYGIRFMRFTRTLSIPPVKLRFAYERFQWQRGANAISLLVGSLRKP